MRDLVASDIILAWYDPTDDLDVVQLAVLVQIKIRVETEINHVIIELAIAKLNHSTIDLDRSLGQSEEKKAFAAVYKHCYCTTVSFFSGATPIVKNVNGPCEFI